MNNTQTTPQIDYSLFLFIKLFDWVHKPNVCYDTEFEEVMRMYEHYNNSPYNNPNKDEYECMVNYLKANSPDFTNY
jgi:hypothetical protein